MGLVTPKMLGGYNDAPKFPTNTPSGQRLTYPISKAGLSARFNRLCDLWRLLEDSASSA